MISANAGTEAFADMISVRPFRVPFQCMRFFVILSALALLLGCGSKSASMEDLGNRDVVLPHGQVIRVETMIDAKDLLRGMMFRTSLAPDRGKLFIHVRQGYYGYWTYQ